MDLPEASTSGSSSAKNKNGNPYLYYRNQPTNYRCVVPECGNNERDHESKVYYVFPEEPWRAKWLSLINVTDLKPTDDDRVCSDHFAPHQYTVRRTLRLDALPTIEKQPTPAIQLKRKLIRNIQRRKRRLDTQPYTETNVPNKEEPIITPQPSLMTTETNMLIEEEKSNIQPTSTPNLLITEVNTVSKEQEPTVKPKPSLLTTETQTVPRKEMYLSVARASGAEVLSIKPGIYEYKVAAPIHTQTTLPLIAPLTDPVKKKIKAEIRDTNKKKKTLTNIHMDKNRFFQCCDVYLNEKIVPFVKSHSHLQEKFKGNRYGNDFKAFALNLYVSDKESYGFVEKIINLPAKVTLLRSQVAVRTGTNQNLIEHLKVKVNKMSEKEKLCALCFDVMRVSKNLWYEVNNDFFCGMEEIDQVLGSEPAEYAAVLMIRGLYTKWKQPVSFSFMTEKRRYPELKEWTHKIIRMMIDIGLDVKVLVANLENDFMDVSLPDGEHYFEVDGRKIYLFYDVRYLFRCARDALMVNNFHIGSRVAEWSHILEVYDKDSDNDLSLMPKITDSHVRSSGLSLDDVNLAIEIFSKTVAAAMNFYVTSNMADRDIKDTVELIAKMSSIFDIFNSKSLANAYKGTEQQNKTLSDVLKYLEELKVKDKRGNTIDAQFIAGLKINIKSAVSLLDDLKEENQNYLNAKVLSTDCLEEYFDECRRLAGNCCEKPTPIQFTRSFRRLFLARLIVKESDIEDLQSILHKISESAKTDTENNEEIESEQIKKILGVGVGDIKIQWPSYEYIAGYLIWKCLVKHPCEKLVENLRTHYGFAEENADKTLLENFQKYNAGNVNSIYLLKPPGYLVEFVDRMDQKFNEYFIRQDRDPVNFAWNSYKVMEEDTFELPCECFPLKFLKILFVRLKIEHSIRQHNKSSKVPRRLRQLQKKQVSKKRK